MAVSTQSEINKNLPETSQKAARYYSPILPETQSWPIVKLARNKKQFSEAVILDAIRRINEITGSSEALVEELELTLYREQLRIRNESWPVDAADEEDFWHKIKNNLVLLTKGGFSHNRALEQEILREIITRYAYEISGDFKRTHYRLARAIATFGFARLLNASRVKGFRSLFSTKYTLHDKIQIMGAIDQLRNLAQKGTVVMVPTHFSNLDSILIGWVIHVLGLPPFIYGAGLNLFNIKLFAYFMNSLGAYKVDRRKKNRIYFETLRSYSCLALQQGAHSLFFPGGTRSRSGSIESDLRLGLLSSAIEAQRNIYEQNDSEGNHSPNKIYVVPVTLNYHFVLEAPQLINEYLKRKGQERYYTDGKNFASSFHILKFLFQFFTKGSDISVSIGQAMDTLGNPVDHDGRSMDQHGREIDTKDYFKSAGQVTRDRQREMEYSKMLSKSIVTSFYKNNQVFSSHLVAYTAFKIIHQKFYKLDLFNLLRLPEEEVLIEYEVFKKYFSQVKNGVFALYQDNKTNIAPHIYWEDDELIKHGIVNVGLYHVKKPLLQNKEGNILTHNLSTLYYYHNRLEGYGLERYIQL